MADKKQTKFVRVHRHDLKSGSGYYMRAKPKPRTCKDK